MRRSRLLVLVIALGPVALVTSGMAAPVLAPHRAVYDLALDRASDRSGITGLAGRMVYEFNGSACEGYTSTFRFVTRINTAEVSRLTDQQTTTFEEGDGKLFTFSTKSYVDQQLDKETRGTATRGQDGVAVDLTKPQNEKVDLALTQFPTHHLMELIDKAGKGETFYETTLFDGSDTAKEVMTTTVIVGKPTTPPSSDPELPALGALSSDRFWPVDMAYFGEPKADEEVAGEELPQYRISFKLHQNGMTRDLVMDYGDFSMTGKLVDFALFEPVKPCQQ